MPQVLAHRLALDTSSTGVTRFLVLSYFIGLGLGLVEGVKVSVLLASFTPVAVGEVLGGVLVVGLSLMILLDVYRRACALVLALLIFWASYLSMFVNAGPDHVGAFWRDLALIGALLLTYSGGMPEQGTSSVPVEKTGAGRSVSVPLWSRDAPKTHAPATQTMRARPVQADPAHPKRMKSELYRQDLEVVRLS
jgi:hypothetical protein